MWPGCFSVYRSMRINGVAGMANKVQQTDLKCRSSLCNELLMVSETDDVFVFFELFGWTKTRSFYFVVAQLKVEIDAWQPFVGFVLLSLHPLSVSTERQESGFVARGSATGHYILLCLVN